MIFVDSNVFLYAVGRAHPLRPEAQKFFVEARKDGSRLVTSAEVLQELLHAYRPAGPIETLDAALELATRGVEEIFPVHAEAVIHGRRLADQYPGRREISSIDPSLLAAFCERRRKL